MSEMLSTSQPVCSIIVPTHNSASFFARLLDSIPRRDDIELIVVDDHSLPEEQSAVKDMVVGCGIAHTCFVVNEGVNSAGAARNVGLALAKGRWLVFADSDDYFTENFATAIDRYADSGADIVLFRPAVVAIGGLGAHDWTRYPDALVGRVPPTEVGLVIAIVVSQFFSREFVIRNDIKCAETKVANDYLFSATAYCNAHRLVVDTRPIYTHVERNGSLVRTRMTRETLMTRVAMNVEVAKYLRRQLRTSTYRRVAPVSRHFYVQALREFGIRAMLDVWESYRGLGLPFVRWTSVLRQIRAVLPWRRSSAEDEVVVVDLGGFMQAQREFRGRRSS
jgi:glycosyltransferase involved in cell wall biosynthesis